MYTGVSGLLLIIANIAFSYQGFKNTAFFDGYQFEVDAILRNKDYKRLFTSGFLHANWTHLLFNMVTLFLFAGPLTSVAGEVKFLVIYFASLLGGNLLALFIHRQHDDYSAIGASGAVAGVVFACLALIPGMGVSFFGLGFAIPGWLYGLVYILYSIYGIRAKRDNIGHEAHLGGALTGMLVALLMQPSALINNYTFVLAISIPVVIFLAIMIARPEVILLNIPLRSKRKVYSIDQQYNEDKLAQQKELDRILDKIAARGMSSLTKKEKETLKQLSGKN